MPVYPHPDNDFSSQPVTRHEVGNAGKFPQCREAGGEKKTLGCKPTVYAGL